MKNFKYYIRKSHRYLGVFIGIQLLFWSVGGLYFSWTNIDEIHGDHLVHLPKKEVIIQKNLLAPDRILDISGFNPDQIESMNLKTVGGITYYKIRSTGGLNVLLNAKTGTVKKPMSKEEAILFAKKIFKPNNDVKDVEYVNEENIKEHGQYRGGVLPAWAVSFDHSSNSVIYIGAREGNFEKIRNKQWRIFDFLWMLHIMDFEEREDINNILLRVFSVFSLLTVLSGFVLFYQSSRTIRKTRKRIAG